MPGSQKVRKQPFWLGGAAASMAACFTHPLDLTKVRMQTRPGTAGKATMLGTLTSSIRTLGVRSVYTGLSAALLRQVSYSMVRFGCYEHMKNVITEGGKKRPTAIQLVVAGGIAGGLGGIAGNPADILLVRMTTDEVRPEKDRFRYKHAIDGLIRLIREEGVSALARGMSANVVSILRPLSPRLFIDHDKTRAVLMNCSQLASYDFFKSWILHSARFNVKDGIFLHASCSVMSGLVATTICSPADVVKSRVMQSATNESMLSVVKTSLRTEGVRFLFKGWTPAFVRLAPNTVLLFVFLEVNSLAFLTHIALTPPYSN
ncbi:dicarboxylate carrier protein [Rhizoctonia solani AG-3 Rhs1AP]|uniref:Dicarboxylate carrier protein n=2 Tax=Rhizoctonia solani AG-3 TaxID=1086053 RepID=A0A074SAT5_9AGAM|nr:dicarboxylate carrier protein [Rhizoctonia solani AG-3 Rhs1AP]KEP54715.1 dicarboxylate carrier protein [Rhizoctonia solani 123E]